MFNNNRNCGNQREHQQPNHQKSDCRARQPDVVEAISNPDAVAAFNQLLCGDVDLEYKYFSNYQKLNLTYFLNIKFTKKH